MELKIVQYDVKSQVGGNLKKINMDTGIKVIPGGPEPGITELKGVKVYPVPDDQKWRLPLLESLLEIRDDQWEIRFDEEHEDDQFDEDDIESMIEDVCTS